MEIGARTALLSIAVSLLLCRGAMGTSDPGSSDPRACDLSIFSTLPSAVMTNFQQMRKHYAQTHSLSNSKPILASLDHLKQLNVPEMRVLVQAEFQLFTEVLGNMTEGVLVRKVRETMDFINSKLTECVTDDALSTEGHSVELSELLKSLKAEMEMDTHEEKVVSNLIQLLNEHLTCTAKGASC